MTTDTESADTTAPETPAADPFNTQMADAARSMAAELGLEVETAPAEADGTTEAVAEPAAEAEPETVDAAPPVVEEPADTSVAEYYEKLAAKDARIRELEAATKVAPPEPDPVAEALRSRDPGKAIAALQQAGLTFEQLAQHVLDNPDGVPDAKPPEAVDPRDARIAKLEAAMQEQTEAKQQQATAAAQQAQESAISGHLTEKADQFPLLVELGRTDLVLNVMRDTHGGTIPAPKDDAEAKLMVEHAAKRVEQALADELAGYAKGAAVKSFLAKLVGQPAPPAAAPTRTGTRDGGSTDAPTSITNATASQRASLGVDDEPDEDELMRRATAELEQQLAAQG